MATDFTHFSGVDIVALCFLGILSDNQFAFTANINLLKDKIETLEKGAKYVQS